MDVVYLVWGFNAWTDRETLLMVAKTLAEAEDCKEQNKDSFTKCYCEAVHQGRLLDP